MRKLFFVILSTILFLNTSAQELRKLNETAFKRGEVLNYRIHYGFIDAATASIEVKDENTLIGGRSTFHIVGIGVTKSNFDWFFKVRDRYETYIDEQALVPWLFIRRVNEGGYIINRNMIFDQIKHTVNSNGKIFKTIPNIQDMLSSFYYARSLDFSNAKKGDLFDVPSFVDNKLFNLQIKFIKRETIKTDFGKIKCLVFVPVLQTGRIFKNEDDMKVWITDDANHIPIRAEADILIGSLKMDLQSYSGLANPITFK
ncbi:MAG TPA: DUF3108 domain-containing protein [Bacteroidia bacterium]|nr:DUF3108 domain-containing protein [Bacteroidia bacterium]